MTTQQDGRAADATLPARSENDASSPTSPRTPIRASRRSLVTSVVVGLVVTLGVLAAGTLYALEQPVRWSADTHHLLAPSSQGEEYETATFYDTLADGQLPATAATILAEDQLLAESAEELGIDPDDVSTRVTVVPETAVIRVEVTADDAQTAEAVADALPERGEETVGELLAPYGLTSLGSAEDTAEQSSLGLQAWLIMLGIAALVAGIAAQQGLYQLSRARVRRA